MPLTVAQLVARLTADTSGFYRGMALANASMIRSGSIISRIAAGTGLAVAGMGILSLRAAGNFQQSMNVLEAVSGATTQQMSTLRNEAIALGRDMKLPNVSAKDAAEAMAELSKAGLSVNDVMGGTRGVLQLGIAANLGFADSAKLVSRALVGFGLDGTQAVRVADLFTAAANKSTAEIGDVALGFQQASARFHTTGQSIEDLTTSITLMANAGIIGSDAGTSLKTMMNRLVAPTAKARATMAEMGFEVYNSSGHVKRMPQIIGSLNKALAGMTEEQKNATMYTIFGSDAIRAATVLSAAGVTGFNKMKDAVTQGGEAQRIAEAKTKGFNGAIGALWSAVETLAISLGSAMLPAAEAVVRAMARFINNIDPAIIIAFFSAIGDGIHWLWDLVAGSDALQAVIVGALAGFVAYKTAVIAISVATRLWAAAQLLLSAAMAANPVVLIIAAIVALAAAFIYAYTHSERFREIVQSVLDTLKGFASALSPLKGMVMAVFGGIVDWLKSQLQILTGVFKLFGALLRGDWGAAWDALKQIASGALNSLKAIIGTALSAIWALIGPAARRAASEITGAFSAVGSFFMSHVVSPIQSAFGALWGFMRETGLKIASAILLPLTVIPGQAGKVAQQMRSNIEWELQKISAAKFTAKLEGELKKGGMTAAAAHTLALGAALVGKTKEVENAALIVGKAIPTGSKLGAKLTPEQMGVIINATIEAVKGKAGQAQAGGHAVGAAVKTGAMAGVAGLSAALAGEVASAVNRAIAAGAAAARAQSPSQEALMKIGRPILEGIILGVTQLSPTMDTKLSTAVKSWIDHAKTTVESQKTRINDAFSRLASDAMTAFDAATQAHKTKSQIILDRIIAAHDAAELRQRLADANTAVTESMANLTTFLAEQGVNVTNVAGKTAATLAEINQQYSTQIEAIRAKMASGELSPEEGQQQIDAIVKNQEEAVRLLGEYEDKKIALQEEKDQQAYDKRVAALTKKAENEKKEYEAARTLQGRHFEDQLKDLGIALEKGLITREQYHVRQMKIFARYGVDYKTAGKNVGIAFAKGLDEAQSNVEAALVRLARLVQQFLAVHSPTEKGPMSDLHRWWGGFADTLVQGLQESQISRALENALPMPQAHPYAGLGQDVMTQQRSSQTVVNIHNPTFLTGDRAAARDFATMLKPELERIVSIGA